MNNSEVNDIKRQFSNGEWRKFVNKVTLRNLRGWAGQTVEFRFPVCAIAGENGAGKSTVLRSVVCAYRNMGPKTVYPSQLFLRTQWDQTSVDNAEIHYEVKQGDSVEPGKWKKTNDWGFSPKGKWPKRHVFFLDITRTIPMDATAGYAKIAKQSTSTSDRDIAIPPLLMREYSHIMGSPCSSARFVTPQPRHDVGLLTSNEVEISQFHQGAGEDLVLDLMKDLVDIPDTSLLIIDEVESSLHPRAQRRLVQFLLKLARQKKLQIIMSTHSPYVLEELPPEGRIFIRKLSDGGKSIHYGISTNFAMGLIDDVIQPDLYVYVEDKESKTLVSRIINGDDELRRRITIVDVGPCNELETLGKLSQAKKLPVNGIAVVDGDKRGEAPHCCPLPSDSPPEKLVFSDLKSRNWLNLDVRFDLGAGSLFSILDDALTNPDHHEYTTQVGNQVKRSKDQVWDIMVEEWCKQCLPPEEKDRILNSIRMALPERST